MDEERFDPILLSIAQNIGQNHGGIDELLDVFLGFLRRKTDAFNPPGGFPQLEASFVAALKRQYDIGQHTLAAKKSAAPAGTKRRAEAPAAAPAKAEVPVIEMSADGSFDATVVPRTAPATTAAAAPPAPSVQAPVTVPRSAAAPAPAEPAEPAATEVAAPGSAASAAPAGGAGGAAEEDAPPRGLPGNGGSTDRYSWSQTLDDLQVALPLPTGTRAKDIVCDIKAKAIKAGRLRGGGGSSSSSRRHSFLILTSSHPPAR